MPQDTEREYHNLLSVKSNDCAPTASSFTYLASTNIFLTVPEGQEEDSNLRLCVYQNHRKWRILIPTVYQDHRKWRIMIANVYQDHIKWRNMIANVYQDHRKILREQQPSALFKISSPVHPTTPPTLRYVLHAVSSYLNNHKYQDATVKKKRSHRNFWYWHHPNHKVLGTTSTGEMVLLGKN